MQTLEPSNQRAEDLYWLAYLLTGEREVSLDVAVDALDAADEANPFFFSWMVAWSRKIVIGKALAAVRGELEASVRRTESRRCERLATPGSWSVPRGAAKFQLERALLTIDLFPRCAVVLSIFEGLSLDDVTILLGATRDVVRKAQAIGLQELTRNLAAAEDPQPAAKGSGLLIPNVQHA